MPIYPERVGTLPVNRIFILGAGFSKAVNPSMPLLGELSDGIQSALSNRGISIDPAFEALDNVEHWLTLLADPAPWLKSSGQMRNSALFNDVSQAIHEVVTAMEIRASIESAPPWLFDLINYWDRTKPVVITFNYDRLVELAFEHIKAARFERGLASELYAIPVTPALMRTSSMLGNDHIDTFSLLKLHGSLSWWYSGPESGESDVIYELRWTGKFGSGITPLWTDELKLVSDKLPMLVPPAATKTLFYKNKLLTTQWAQAAEALNNADELVLMGYSAPVTDLTVTSLIATEFNGSTIVPVDIGDSIIARARELGSRSNPPDVVESFIDPDAIAKWTAANAS